MPSPSVVSHYRFITCSRFVTKTEPLGNALSGTWLMLSQVLYYCVWGIGVAIGVWMWSPWVVSSSHFVSCSRFVTNTQPLGNALLSTWFLLSKLFHYHLWVIGVDIGVWMFSPWVIGHYHFISCSHFVTNTQPLADALSRRSWCCPKCFIIVCLTLVLLLVFEGGNHGSLAVPIEAPFSLANERHMSYWPIRVKLCFDWPVRVELCFDWPIRIGWQIFFYLWILQWFHLSAHLYLLNSFQSDTLEFNDETSLVLFRTSML